MSFTEVNVSNIARETTKEHLADFFTFCGKIASIDFNKKEHTATIHFEKAAAAKTALMLNGGALGGAHLTVAAPSDDEEEEDEEEEEESETEQPSTEATTPASEPITEQTAKPKAGLAAQYLAKGYTLSDQIYQRALELDAQRGISRRFTGYIQQLDNTLGQKALGPEKTVSGAVSGRVSQTFTVASAAFGTASQAVGSASRTASQSALGASRSLGQTASQSFAQARERARSIDESARISARAGDYYTRAVTYPLGQKIKEFYTTTTKQVFDIHEEARRIASQSRTNSLITQGSASTPGDIQLTSPAAPLDKPVVA